MVIFTRSFKPQFFISTSATIKAFVLLGILISGNVIADEQKINSNHGIEQQTNQKLNVNNADLQQLMAIKGLGKVKAQAILDHIQVHGDLVSLDELTEVRGIGKKLVAKVRDKLTI